MASHPGGVPAAATPPGPDEMGIGADHSGGPALRSGPPANGWHPAGVPTGLASTVSYPATPRAAGKKKEGGLERPHSTLWEGGGLDAAFFLSSRGPRMRWGSPGL